MMMIQDLLCGCLQRAFRWTLPIGLTGLIGFGSGAWAQKVEEFRLTQCPRPLMVTIPSEFSRAPSAEAAAEGWCRIAGFYECLYNDWTPGVWIPRMVVKAELPLTEHKYERGELDEKTWMRTRSLDWRSARQYEAIIEFIRKYEPSAPDDDAEVIGLYPHLFMESASRHEIRKPWGRGWVEGIGEWISVRRENYVRGCVFSFQFYIPVPSEKPISALNRYFAETVILER